MSLKPCKSPYCECTPGHCEHPGCYDDRAMKVETDIVLRKAQEGLRKLFEARTAALYNSILNDIDKGYVSGTFKERVPSPDFGQKLAQALGKPNLLQVDFDYQDNFAWQILL